MNKKSGFSKQTAAGIAFTFGGIIIISELNLVIGVIIMAIGIYLIASN